jgi:hypothetical protein
MPKKKRSKPNVPYVVSPRRVDAGEILALARSGKKPRFRVSGPEPTAEFIKGMLKLLGVPARRVMAR